MMRRRLTPRLLAVGLIALCVAGLSLAAPSAAQPAAPEQSVVSIPRDKGTPFGVVAALGNRVRDDEVETYVRLMREAGVQWQREEFFWDRIQKEPGGPMNFGGDGSGLYNYDYTVAAQTNAGIRLLGLLDYNPYWFKGKNPHPDEWIKDWGDFVYAVVARYGRDRGQIKHWELWNEPNLAGSGYESGLYLIEDYVRLLQVGYVAAKAADPEATIVLGGLASIWDQAPSAWNYDYPFYLNRVGELGGFNYFDVVALHPYRPDSPELAPWKRDASVDFRDEMRIVDEIMARYGPKPVWLTELGWSTSRVWPGVDEDTQAFYLVRTYVLAMSHASIEKIFWYDFRNDSDPNAPYDRPVYNNNEVQFHYGLIRRSYPLRWEDPRIRKPGFLAFRTMTEMLGGMTMQVVAADGRDPNMPNLYWYRFGGVGRRVDVLWRTNDNAPSTVEVACECRQALLRLWNGQVRRLYQAENGLLTINLDGIGAPIYVEYDPPVPAGGRTFELTGNTIRGAFSRYWEANGGLARFGYPLTEEIVEPEGGTGLPRTVQYFERARFEHFPELSGTAYEVQLGLLGNAILLRQGVDWRALPKVSGAPEDCLFFEASGHSLCPPFRQYWEQNGGLVHLGLPLTEPYPQQGQGRPDYTVQYFERARMEAHPEFEGTPYEVLLGLLGREWLSP
jgi:hypothetical protein